MAFAKVSVSCVSKFKRAVCREGECAKTLKSSTSCVERIESSVKNEIKKLERCEKNCNIAISDAKSKQEKYESERKYIETHLPERTIRKREWAGTDSEGDDIYEWVEYPNPEYERAQQRLHALYEKIHTLQNLIQELRSQMSIMENYKSTYTSSLRHLRDDKQKIDSECSKLSSKSEMASTQLGKAIAAIEGYLAESISLSSVPSHTVNYDSGYSYTPSYEPTVRADYSRSTSYSQDKKTEKKTNPGQSQRAAKVEEKQEYSKPERTVDNVLQDAKSTNPQYSSGEEWQRNCQRCVPTYEMRCRGYDVSAKPCVDPNDYLMYHPFDVWKNPDIKNPPGDGLEDIKNSMAQWGDGARAQIVFVWADAPSGHTIIAEQRDGKTFFIDPQSNDTDVIEYFQYVSMGKTRYCRIDNLDVSKHIKDCYKEN